VAGLSRYDDFACAVHIVRDDGNARYEGLGEDAGEALAKRAVDEKVEGLQKPGDMVGRDEAAESHSFRDAEFAGAPLEGFSQRAVADEQEPDAGKALQHRGGDGEDVVVAFEFEEAGDLADNDVFGGNGKLASDFLGGRW